MFLNFPYNHSLCEFASLVNQQLRNDFDWRIRMYLLSLKPVLSDAVRII